MKWICNLICSEVWWICRISTKSGCLVVRTGKKVRGALVSPQVQPAADVEHEDG